MAASKVAATNSAIINAVRNNASEQYRARIPEITDNNLTKTLALLQENSLLWNEFIQVLVQRIGLTLFRTNSFENRLKPFKTGAMAYGGVVQEIGANLIKAKAYDPNDTNVFGAEKPDVKAFYHSVNRRDRYDLRLNEDMLEEAFVQDGQLSGFINNLLALPQQSDENDEYLIMRDILRKVHDAEGMATIRVDDMFATGITADEKRVAGEGIAATLREHYLQMKNFYNTKYNTAGMLVTSDDLVLLGTPRFFANFDVSVLAAAFNMDRANFIADRTVVIDDFNISGVDVALVDRDFYVCADTKIKSASIYNPASLDMDYFYHHWGVYSASPMRNALLLSTTEETNITAAPARTVSKVEIKLADPVAENKAVAPGAEIALNTVVTYSDNSTDGRAYTIITGQTAAEAADGVWNVVLPDTGTYIDRMGVLHISENSKYTAITVTAISNADGKKSANIALVATA
mgnify:CR=1 FL=1